MKDYISLHNHTTYSLMDSLIKPSVLFDKAKEYGQSAIAVTDHGTLSAVWDAFKASKKTRVKLIIGCEFNFVDDVSKNNKIRHLILLARNHEGYKNLLKLNKLANDNNILIFNKTVPRIDWKLLKKYSAGLICTTACSGGILGQLINTKCVDEAKRQAKRLKDIFGDFLALEVQPNMMRRNATPYNDYDDQRYVNRILVKLGEELDIRVIAATDAHYVLKDDWEAHDVLLSIGSGIPVKAETRPRYPAHDFYIKTRDEVVSSLSRDFGQKAEEFCDNTIYFSNLCEKPNWIDPKYSNPSGKELPEFPVKDQLDYLEFQKWISSLNENITINCGEDEVKLYLKYKCEQALNSDKHIKHYKEFKPRTEKELDVFEYKSLSSYMLIVSDYVNWARNNGISVGPARGSVGGSLVAYLLGIHDINPIKYGLVFERFYNKLKEGMSDIDVDFSKVGKPKVEAYIVSKYGEDFCAKISNYTTLKPKPYARYMAKAFQFGGSSKSAIEVGNEIANAIPKELSTVSTVSEYAPLYAEYVKKYPQLERFAKNIGNIDLNYSVHAGAVIIGKRPLVEFVPLRVTKEGFVSTEYEKERAEENGLVKMDILGVSTLDIIDQTFELIKAQNKKLPELPWDYDKEDFKTYELIGKGDTFGVFQLGKSAGTVQLCVDMKPKNIEDLAMINSMARPGFPKEIRNDFIECKKRAIVRNVIHDSLKRSLEPTFGFALFDEVLLNLAQDVAGWDLAEADRLRKFVKEKGKNRDKDKKLKDDFIASTVTNGIPLDMAVKIWDEVLFNFGSYIFNKAHAVGYSFLSYQTAYLKAHYPIEFLICNLIHEDEVNTQVSDENKTIIKREIRNLGIKFKAPDINKSFGEYTILDANNVLTGLNSLKYMGKDAIPEILENRPFSDFNDLFSSLDGRKVKISSIQAMAASGCLDDFGLTRKQMFLYASDYKKKLQVWNKRRQGEKFIYPWPDDIGEWTISEKYAQEVYYIGEGLCCGIKDAYPGFFDGRAIKFTELANIFPEPEHKEESNRGRKKKADDKFLITPNIGIVQGIIKSCFEFKVKNQQSKIFGQIMAKIDIEDLYGGVTSMALFPYGLELMKERIKELSGGKAKLEPGTAVWCSASISWYEGEPSLIFENLAKVAPIPPRPKDLKARKVSMKITSSRKNKKINKIDPDVLLEQIEDELIEEGFSEL